jgi:L-amino acid N-acyltransferase YncA
MSTPSVIVRDATDHDIAAIQSIYAHHVLKGTASFEEIPPSAPQMTARWLDVQRLGLPYLVAQIDGVVIGYAYASAYRPRPAYRHTVEDSVYVASGHHRLGIGRTLLAALIARCEAGPWRQMIAVIGDSANKSSIALHERFGFAHAGTLRNVGFKLGRWLDSVLMQRTLGPGADAPPAAPVAPMRSPTT